MQKATPERARLHNTQLVLRTIYAVDEISRAEIARTTGLTRPTVSDVVSGLLKDGLVEEVGLAPSAGGRRAMLLRVVDHSRCLIGLDLSREDFRGALIDLRGKVLHRIDLPLQGRDGEDAIDLIYDLVDQLIEQANTPILGIGIGAPGLVDAANGVMRQAVNLNWRDVPLRDLVHERYSLPVYIANDCQAAALAEDTFGNSGQKSIVVIKVGWGVGAGIVLDGDLLHGNPSGAGEIGHVKVVEDGLQCACGNYGCLETVASSRAIVRQSEAIAKQHPNLAIETRSDQNPILLEEVCRAYEDGNEIVRELVVEVGKSLGISAANLVAMLGSCQILVSGSVTCFGQELLDAIQAEMSSRTLPALAKDTEIGFASLGSDIVLLGASALLLSHELGVL